MSFSSKYFNYEDQFGIEKEYCCIDCLLKDITETEVDSGAEGIQINLTREDARKLLLEYCRR